MATLARIPTLTCDYRHFTLTGRTLTDQYGEATRLRRKHVVRLVALGCDGYLPAIVERGDADDGHTDLIVACARSLASDAYLIARSRAIDLAETIGLRFWE